MTKLIYNTIRFEGNTCYSSSKIYNFVHSSKANKKQISAVVIIILSNNKRKREICKCINS